MRPADTWKDYELLDATRRPPWPTGGEIWKLEDCIYDLISQCEEVLSDQPLFFAVNSYTTGLSPAVMEYMLKTTLVPRFGGQTSCDEIGLPVSATGGVVPCGATAIWEE